MRAVSLTFPIFVRACFRVFSSSAHTLGLTRSCMRIPFRVLSFGTSFPVTTHLHNPLAKELLSNMSNVTLCSLQCSSKRGTSLLRCVASIVGKRWCRWCRLNVAIFNKFAHNTSRQLSSDLSILVWICRMPQSVLSSVSPWCQHSSL